MVHKVFVYHKYLMLFFNNVQQSDPFEGGSFDMDLLFKEFDNDEKDDVTLCYARYCALRAQARLSDKDKDICYICHFKHNKVTPLPKQRVSFSNLFYSDPYTLF